MWKPVYDALRKRMQDRGLEKAMAMGMLCDLRPDKDEVAALHQASGGLPWASHSHPNPMRGKKSGEKLLHGIADICYAAHVYALGYQVNPQKGERQYGWRSPVLNAHFPRGGGLNSISSLTIRHLPAFNITGAQRGTGRIGADLWPASRDGSGQRVAQVHDRYPENHWRNLDLDSWLLAPGPDGALATVRFENLREGMQEAEARIYIEDVLLDTARRATIGEDLAKRCQALLDEHHRAMWKTIWFTDEDLDRVGPAMNGRNPTESFWKALEADGKKMAGYYDGSSRQLRGEEARKGQAWWFESGWQKRNKAIFTLAGEVAAKLAAK